MSDSVDNSDVQLQVRNKCAICKIKPRPDGKSHRCMECNALYDTVEDVISHCSRAGHTGGHSTVLDTMTDRPRLKPIRFRRSASEDDLLHKQLGLYDEIDPAADGESSDDDDDGAATEIGSVERQKVCKPVAAPLSHKLYF
jgi:predicted  nucleic acid-binding Zn-ribbon protein